MVNRIVVGCRGCINSWISDCRTNKDYWKKLEIFVRRRCCSSYEYQAQNRIQKIIYSEEYFAFVCFCLRRFFFVHNTTWLNSSIFKTAFYFTLKSSLLRCLFHSRATSESNRNSLRINFSYPTYIYIYVLKIVDFDERKKNK